MSSKKLRFFNSLSKPFVKIVEKYYPDAFIFVIVLSVLTFVLALVNTESSPVQVLEAWGNGLPKLFTFTAQISIIMITAHALAHTNPVEKILSILFMIRFIWNFNKFEDIFLLTGGASGTRTLPINVYEQGFSIGNIGMGSAVSMVIVLLLLFFMLIYFKLIGKRANES